MIITARYLKLKELFLYWDWRNLTFVLTWKIIPSLFISHVIKFNLDFFDSVIIKIPFSTINLSYNIEISAYKVISWVASKTNQSSPLYSACLCCRFVSVKLRSFLPSATRKCRPICLLPSSCSYARISSLSASKVLYLACLNN